MKLKPNKNKFWSVDQAVDSTYLQDSVCWTRYCINMSETYGDRLAAAKKRFEEIKESKLVEIAGEKTKRLEELVENLRATILEHQHTIGAKDAAIDEKSRQLEEQQKQILELKEKNNALHSELLLKLERVASLEAQIKNNKDTSAKAETPSSAAITSQPDAGNAEKSQPNDSAKPNDLVQPPSAANESVDLDLSDDDFLDNDDSISEAPKIDTSEVVRFENSTHSGDFGERIAMWKSYRLDMTSWQSTSSSPQIAL